MGLKPHKDFDELHRNKWLYEGMIKYTTKLCTKFILQKQILQIFVESMIYSIKGVVSW